MYKYFIILFLCLSVGAIAQQQDEQLAAQYMSNNEFDKAAEVYERLFNKGNKSTYLYDNLLTCYFKLNNYDEAEKFVKKQQRKEPLSAYYAVDLGYIQEKSNQVDKAKKTYDNIVNKLNASYDNTLQTANAFKKRNKIDYALTTYLKSRKLNGNNPNLYCIELAQLYADKKETGLMLQEYLSEINQNPQIISDVQGYLQLYLDNDADFELLKQTLFKKSKDFPSNELYTEMLVWLFVQRKDFDNALIQTRAIDKRNRMQGQRILQLADLALANQKYDAADKAYQEVLLMGSDNPNYIKAKLGVLRARNQKIFYSGNYTTLDLTILETEYNNFLKEFGRYPFTAQSIRELANLQAYYLFKYQDAIGNYNELINMPRLDNRFRAECKLDLGDIYVLKGEEWEAMLLYGQVDKEFLEDPLGQEAKFRNAKLSYYLGEFDWARAQLDVLKTATTQLIANNAIELSLQIQDNTIDSNDEPMRWFARADLYFFQNRLSDATRVLDSIEKIYPKHDLTDDVMYKRAEIALKQKDYNQAITYFDIVFKEHGSDILGDNALYYIADIYESKLNNKEEARKKYELFIEKYPASFFLNEVRKRFRSLRGDVN
ncbi:MAG: tetratricopeptide repeat protein [Bacteroidia bacterium]|nr:tetratricopeptide repeat protein [Bacteroidia bacterium]